MAIKKKENEISRHSFITQSEGYYTPEKKQMKGKDYLVVPVIMMKEGVHAGSAGPIFHKAEELARSVSAWNGRPISINHPTKDGKFVSANAPELAEEHVGAVYNTRFEDGKLRGDAWLNEEDLKKVSIDAYNYILQGYPMDVSTGAFTEDEYIQGNWNGEVYKAISHNYKPDHLALLPNEAGACSWKDGCGIRVNKDGESEKINGKTAGKTLQILARAGFTANRLEYKAIIASIQQALDERYSDKYCFVEEVYSDYFIYGVEDAITSEYYRLGYEKENGEIKITGQPIAVEKKVDFVQANIVGGGPMGKKNDATDKMQALIETGTFSDEQKEQLEELKESWAVLTEAKKENKELVKQVKELQDKVVSLEKEEPEVQLNKEQAVQVLKEQLSKPEEFVKLLPQEYREQTEHGIRLYKERRHCIAEAILANTDAFSADELRVKPMEELEKLHKAVRKVDFSVNTVQPTRTIGQRPLLPAGVKEVQ